MKTFAIIATALILSTQIGTAQIQIKNYKMNEVDNWNSQIQLNARDLQLFRAGVHNTNEMTMDVEVLLNVEATSYAAVFSIRQVAETAFEVNTLLNERLNAFKSKLIDLEIDKNYIVVDVISQVPIYGIEREKRLFSRTLAEIPIGFELHKNIIITFTEYDFLNDIVYEASKNEIYDLIKVDYFADNPQAYFDTMRHAASNYLQVVESKYRGGGFDLDSFTKMMAENTGAVYPISRYHKYQGLSRLSYKKLLKNVGSGITMDPVVSPSLYYNHLPFTNFDIVINSTISKPSIQYTFHMQARYSRIPKPVVKVEKKVEKQFFFITGDGEVKFIDMK